MGLNLIEAVAAKNNRSWHTLRRYIRAGKVRAVRIDGRLYVEEDDVVRLLAPVPVAPTADPAAPRGAA